MKQTGSNMKKVVGKGMRITKAMKFRLLEQQRLWESVYKDFIISSEERLFPHRKGEA